MRPPAAIGQTADTRMQVALVNLVADLAGDAEFGAEPRHLLAVQQAGDKPETLVDHVTLLPRHAPRPLKRDKVS